MWPGPDLRYLASICGPELVDLVGVAIARSAILHSYSMPDLRYG